MRGRRCRQVVIRGPSGCPHSVRGWCEHARARHVRHAEPPGIPANSPAGQLGQDRHRASHSRRAARRELIVADVETGLAFVRAGRTVAGPMLVAPPLIARVAPQHATGGDDKRP